MNDEKNTGICGPECKDSDPVEGNETVVFCWMYQKQMPCGEECKYFMGGAAN